jgi:hypothetical protein
MLVDVASDLGTSRHGPRGSPSHCFGVVVLSSLFWGVKTRRSDAVVLHVVESKKKHTWARDAVDTSRAPFIPPRLLALP